MAIPNPRRYSWNDFLLISLQKGLSTFVPAPRPSLSTRLNPGAKAAEPSLSHQEQSLSASLMRINHCGEICAQALYLGQSFATKNQHLRAAFSTAAAEEEDHLNWCEQRLYELNSHKSYLNPFWFVGSFVIGTFAGMAGDRWSLGFLAETEKQVGNHLAGHLVKLPVQDEKSRLIVLQMQQDEAKHATTAIDLGAANLPFVVKITMRTLSKIMTKLVHYV